MAEWNPNSTPTKGLEWPAASAGSITLDSLVKNACQSIIQTASQAIGTIRVWVSSLPTRGGLYAVEVYDNETAVAANVATLTARPNEDVSGNSAAAWDEDDGTTVNIFDQIDEAVLDTADYIKNDSNNTTRYVSRMDTGGLSLTGKRILAVRLAAVEAGALGGFGSNSFGLNIGGADYFGFVGTGIPTPTLASFTWYYNPATKRPWTIADVQAFDTTDEWYVDPLNLSAGGSVRVHQAYMEVVVCDENRIAVGTLDDTLSALTPAAWNAAASVLTPTGGVWTKDGAGRHLYLLRRLTSAGVIVIPTLAGPAAPNPARGFSPILDPTYGYATAMGSSTPTVFPLIQRTTAPAESVDSQPYEAQLVAQVFSGQDAEGEFSNAAVANYGLYRFLAKYAGTPTGDLLVKLRRRSDNVQFGTTVTVTKAQIDAIADAGGGWKFMEVAAGTFGTLATATQYYIEFSSSTDSGNAWHLLALDTGDQGNGAGFGGTTDRALVNASEADRYDLAATVGSVPAAPASLTATLSAQTLSTPETGCGIERLSFIALNWSDTALGASFGYYELERSSDGGVTWETIARPQTEADSDFADYEAPRGMSIIYRVRVVRTDGAFSVWSNTPGGVSALADDGALWLVSNEEPSLNVGYIWEPDREYAFPSADEGVEVPIYGEDGSVVLRPTEDRLARFRASLTIAAFSRPSARGVTAFAPLRALEAAQGLTIPYVCVLDHMGNRFLADISVPGGRESQPAELHLAEITVRELTRTPFVSEP